MLRSLTKLQKISSIRQNIPVSNRKLKKKNKTQKKSRPSKYLLIFISKGNLKKLTKTLCNSERYQCRVYCLFFNHAH